MHDPRFDCMYAAYKLTNNAAAFNYKALLLLEKFQKLSLHSFAVMIVINSQGEIYTATVAVS